MSYINILKTFPTPSGKTPQTEPMPGMIPNNAGGFFYGISDWERLDRFLLLGTDSGTYYVNSNKLTKENAEITFKLLNDVDFRMVIDRAVELSTENRLPKNDTALFVFALAAAHTKVEVRQYAFQELPKVLRTATSLLMFVDFVTSLRGWGSALRKAVGRYFLDTPEDKLALQAVKYNNRHGWALRDLLRVSHPKIAKNSSRNDIIQWILGKEERHDEGVLALSNSFTHSSHLILGVKVINALYESYKSSADCHKPISIHDIYVTIVNFNLPREAIPTELLNNKEVWKGLLFHMPITAMMRNLAKMTNVGLFDDSGMVDHVVHQLSNEDVIKQKLHPMQIMLALRTYAKGRGELGKLTWTPNSRIIDALDLAFDASFKNVVPTNKKILVGLDVSGSMIHQCLGSPILSCVAVAAAIGCLFVRTEPNATIIGFDTQIRPLGLSPRQRLDDIIKNMGSGGGTDLSLPVRYALHESKFYDAFVIVTDNETWAGNQHACQALNEYRKRINPKVKLIVIAASANGGSIAHPDDPLSLGIGGFDPSIPQIVSEFLGR